MAKAQFTAWGGADTVTGSNFAFRAGSLSMLIDCGLNQDGANPEAQNVAAFPYEPSSINVLFVTHAHMDHVGRIPKLIKDGFAGRIISTPETKALARLMLEDAAHVLADRYHRGEGVPLYRQKDVADAFNRWEEVGYHDPIALEHGLTVRFLDAGHILGSAMVEFTYLGDKMVFSGDLGNSPSPLLKDTESLDGVRHLVMESVYGDRNHEPASVRREKLMKAVADIHARRGTLIIPSFSLERTQVILSELNELVEEGKVKPLPVFLDSPLSIKVTEVYRSMRDNWNDRMLARIKNGDEPFEFPRLAFTPDRDDSMKILAVSGPKIVIAGSGMSTGGRIMKHERAYLPDKRNILLLVGYQSLGTLGRQIADGAKSVSIDGAHVPVRAEVRQIEGYSSHKGLDGLVSFVEDTADTLETVFVAMGEPKSSLFLVQRLREYLDVNALSPTPGITYPLSFADENSRP